MSKSNYDQKERPAEFKTDAEWVAAMQKGFSFRWQEEEKKARELEEERRKAEEVKAKALEEVRKMMEEAKAIRKAQAAKVEILSKAIKETQKEAFENETSAEAMKLLQEAKAIMEANLSLHNSNVETYFFELTGEVDAD